MRGITMDFIEFSLLLLKAKATSAELNIAVCVF